MKSLDLLAVVNQVFSAVRERKQLATSFPFESPIKMSFPTVSTVFGRFIDLRAVHLSNAPSPKVVSSLPALNCTVSRLIAR